MSSHKCGKATSNFESFLAEDLSKHATEFQSFSYLSEVFAYPQSWSGISSHVQAWCQLELIKTNMGPESVTTKRLIIDHMVANNLKQHKIEITKPMLKDLGSLVLHKRFTETLTEREKQALHISDDIKKLKLQVKQKDSQNDE